MRTVATESSTTTQAAPPTLEPALADAWKKFSAAFNRLDAKEVAAFWEVDGTLIGPTGNKGIGRAGVEKVYADDVDEILRGTTSTFTVQTVRMLGRDLAWLDMEHDIRGARMPDGSSGTVKLHVVVLARRQGKEWRWLDTRPYAFLRPPRGTQLH